MATLNLPFSFVAGTLAKSSEVNANNNAIVSWSSNIDNGNFGTMTGVVSWNITTGDAAIDITNSGNEGSIQIVQNASLNPNKSDISVVNNAIQTNGDAGIYVNYTSISSTVPALKIDYKGYENFVVKPDTVKLPIRTEAERDALGSPVTGDLLYNSDKKEFQYHDGTAWSPIGVPTGTILPWGGGNTPPDGYFLCDGSTKSRTTEAKLFAVVGSRWGDGDGGTTFHLPDGRGRFLRGVDSGAGRDPDAGSRTESNSGGATGDNPGSVQDDAYESHGHTSGVQSASHTHQVVASGTVDQPLGATNPVGQIRQGVGDDSYGLEGKSSSTANYGKSSTQSASHTHTINASGGNETRPKNMYTNFIIKR